MTRCLVAVELLQLSSRQFQSLIVLILLMHSAPENAAAVLHKSDSKNYTLRFIPAQPPFHSNFPGETGLISKTK